MKGVSARPGWSSACGLAAMLAGLGLLAAGVAGPVQAQSGGSGLELFRAMLPAFQDARCVNCHGGVDVISGDGHGGGAVDGAADLFSESGAMTGSNTACLACHTALTTTVQVPADPIAGTDATTELQGPWRLAPRQFSFVGKDALALCDQVRRFGLAAGEAEFLRHMGGDSLIRLAFIGRRGDATTQADPPPITDAQFVAAAQRWAQDGMGCDAAAGWAGMLRRVERDNTVWDPQATSGTQAGLPISTLQKQERHGTWTQTWEIVPGSQRNLTPDGRFLTLRAKWTAEYAGSESWFSSGVGVASCANHQLLSVTRTNTREVTRAAKTTGEVDAKLSLMPGGGYAIDALPSLQPSQQTVTTVERSTMSGGCAPEPPKETTQTSTVSMAWSSASARGTADPDAPDALSGTDETTVPRPPNAGFTLDKGTTTTWELRRS